MEAERQRVAKARVEGERAEAQRKARFECFVASVWTNINIVLHTSLLVWFLGLRSVFSGEVEVE